MKYILSILVTVAFFISESKCYRIKRQSDAIFFPNDDNNDNVAATLFFGRPNRRPRPNAVFGQVTGIAPGQNADFLGVGSPTIGGASRPNGNFIETSPEQIFGNVGRPNANFMEIGPVPIFNGDGQPNGNFLETDRGPRTTRTPQQPPSQPTEAPTPRPTPSAQFLRCMKACPTTTEYNPVCGSDQIQYHNRQRLQCANRCGANVQFVRNGNCQGVLPTRTIRF